MNSSTRFWLILVAGLVLVTVLAGGAGSDGPPLDPRSVNPDGTRGVVETLERLGADVELDSAVPASDVTAALLIVDRLSSEDADHSRPGYATAGRWSLPIRRASSLRSGAVSPATRSRAATATSGGSTARRSRARDARLTRATR